MQSPNDDAGSAPVSGAALYIDLLKQCVSNSIYDDDLDMMRGPVRVDPVSGKYSAAGAVVPTSEQKYYGDMWPTRAHTMIGIPRLDNVQHCMETVLRDGVPGDVIETGVWRGGTTIFMRGILKAYGITDRTVWVADSFQGLPAGDHARYPKETDAELHKYQQLAISLADVKKNFERYGLLDDQVRFLKGWFSETLPTAPIARLAVMRLDGDLYESTMDGLVNLYPKLSPGGFVIVDDYGAIEACDEAVADYRKSAGITAEIVRISSIGAYWRKPAVV
jgi:O-methyltransferase